MTSAPVDDALLDRCDVCWTCTRRSSEAVYGATLERVRFMLSIRPLDRQHVMLEAWLERDGVRRETVLEPVSRPIVFSADGRFAHLDVDFADGRRLLSMTLVDNRRRVIYARTTLLAAAGLHGGTYDPPMLLHASVDRIAQSA